MSNLLELLRKVCAHRFNHEQETHSQGSKTSINRRFILESLETRVLLSVDPGAIGALIEQPDLRPEQEILLIFTDTEDSGVVTAGEKRDMDVDEAIGIGFEEKHEGEEEEGGDFIEHEAYEEAYGDFDYEEFLMLEQEEGPQGGQGGIVEDDVFPLDVLTNNNAAATGTSQFTQSETTVIAFGNTVLVAFNDSGSISGGTNKFTGFSRSTDGGVTFTDGGVLPTNPGGDAGDPVLARNDTTGRIYFSTLSMSTAGTIQMFRSDDGGATWMLPVNATPGGSGEDKQWHTVDNFAGPGNGNVYLVSRRFGGAAPAQGIYFFRSTDDGATFGPDGGSLIVAANQGAFVSVGPDHSVYVFWWQGSTIQMRKSTDQGLTFGTPVTVASGLAAPIGAVNGDLGLIGTRQGTAAAAFRSNEFPHAAVNPVNGDIYVTYNNDVAGTDKADVFLVQSVDGGATWGAPVRVNDDFTTTDQWQPTLAVTPEGDKLGIFYSSRQEDPANNLFKYYGRIADISGSTLTFTPSFAISDTASLPEFGRDGPVIPIYMGDYNTAYATTGFFHVAWSDNRDDLAGGAGRKDPNVYYKAIDLGLTVRSTTPLNGAVIPVIPLDYVVNFSDPIQAATVDTFDFTVDGVIADSFIINSPTQVTFHYLTSPFSINGLHTMAMAADSILRNSDGDTLAGFSGSFRWDSLLLQVTSTVPPAGTSFPPGLITYDVNFNEVINPTSVQTWDLVLGGITGATVSAVTLLPGNTTVRFTLSGILEGTLTANIMAGAIADVFGNPGAAFATSHEVDVITAPYPTPLINKNPLGSLIYDPTQTGVISFTGDVDNYTLNVDPNQTFSVILTPTTTTFQPQIEIRDPNNVFRGFASAPAPGQAAIIQTNYASIGGVYNFAVSGVGSTLGGYTLQVILNSALEQEGRIPGAVNNGLSNLVETAVNGVDSGWIMANGSHTATNNNYIVGLSTVPAITEIRNYATFTLSPWTPAIIGAELRLFNPIIGYSSPDPTETYTLFDVSATAAALDTTRPVGDATGITIFNDLGSGTIYGTRAVSAADNNTTVAIPLNAAAVAALNAAIGSTVSFGGAITTLAGTVTQSMFGGSSGALGTVQLILRSMGPTQNIDSSFITLSKPQGSAERGAVLGQADAGNYAASAGAFTFEDISATGIIITPLANQDNTGVSIPIGFTFPFYGVSNTSVIVVSNGLLNLVAPPLLAPLNTDLTTAPTVATIAPFWDDLHIGGGLPNSNVYFQTLGTGNNQHLTVQWNNVRFASGGVAGDTITFEAQLYVDGRIQFNYLDLVSGTAPGNNGASATVGVKAAGTQGPNRLLLAFNDGPNAFVGTGQSTLLTVTTPPSDYYSFALDAGEIVTLAATGQTAGNLSLELRDSSDAVLAIGVGSANLTSVISNFAVSTGGIYYARITGDGATTPAYSLVVTKNAAFDTENNGAANAQTWMTQGALGSIFRSAPIIAIDTGWITTDGTHQAANNNYLVGQQLFGGNPLSQYRDYFTFSLPAGTGTIIGAELRVVNPAGGYVSTDPTETYTLFDVSATPAALDANRLAGDPTGMAIHADLGSGTIYGTRVVSAADNNTTLAITLNADAVAALNAALGSTISFGGAITSLAGTATQVLFAFSGAPGSVQLVLQLADDDWYSITLPSTANALRLETSTPGDGPGQPVNSLNPIIELYDSTGTTLLASGVAMADGRNEFILATGLTPGGTYKVRVNGASGTSGEYFLTRSFSSFPLAASVDLASPANEEDTAWSGALNDPSVLEGRSSDVESYTVAVKKLRPFLDDTSYDDFDKEAGTTGDDWFFVTDTLDERY